MAKSKLPFMDNVIIFTTGASGSSVLAGILATQGYYVGDKTAQLDFNTYENEKLVTLDMELLYLSGYRHRDANNLPPPDTEKLQELHNIIDVEKYLEFIQECDANRPWLWKDPRFAFTVHFWKHLMDFKDVRFIIITREFAQAYAGLILKRKVYMRPNQYKKILENYHMSIEKFLRGYTLSPVFRIQFENLLFYPEKTIEELNRFLGTSLSLRDVTSVYKGAMGKRRYSKRHYLLAVAAYIIKKNIYKDVVRFPRSI